MRVATLGADSVIVTPVTPSHVAELCAVMRLADVEECHRVMGMTAQQALIQSINDSSIAATMLIGDKVLALFGACEPRGLVSGANVWVLTSVLVDKHPRLYFRATRWAADKGLEMYGQLFGVVDWYYTAALRWTELMGCTLHGPIDYGPNNTPVMLAKLVRRN